MSLQTVITYSSASELSFDTALVEVSGGLVRLKDLGGATYSMANPVVETQARLQATALTSFAESKVAAGSDQVKYQLNVNGTNYWHNGSDWVASAGTYAESNTAAEISAALSTLLTQLSIVLPFYLKLRVFLHSATGATRPTLTSNTWVYSLSYGAPPTISECLVYAYLTDLLGAQYAYDAEKPARLLVSNYRSFMHGSKLVQSFAKEVAFNSSGYAELSVIETETPGEFVSFSIVYWDGRYEKTIRFNKCLVPNTPTRALAEITQVSPQDAG